MATSVSVKAAASAPVSKKMKAFLLDQQGLQMASAIARNENLEWATVIVASHQAAGMVR